jgi:hypothetical protein
VAVGDWLGNTHGLSDRLGRWDASLHNIGSAHSLGNILGDSVADLTGHGVAHFTGNWVADLVGNRVADFTSNWVTDLTSNRVAHLARNWARSLNWDLTAHSLGGGLALGSRNGVSMSGNSSVVKATAFTIFISISFALPATSKSSTKRRNNSSKRRNNSSAISRDNSTSSGSIDSDS